MRDKAEHEQEEKEHKRIVETMKEHKKKEEAHYRQTVKVQLDKS